MNIILIGNEEIIASIYEMENAKKYFGADIEPNTEKKRIALICKRNEMEFYLGIIDKSKLCKSNLKFYDTDHLSVIDIYFYLRLWQSIDNNSLLSTCNNSRYVFRDPVNRTIIRSSSLYHINSLEIDVLKEHNVNSVIDLRSHGNSELENDLYKKGICYYHSPLTTKNGILYTSQLDSYNGLLENYDAVYNIMKNIIECKDKLVIFCKYGKDRTGIISILLELIANSEYNEIILNYISSQYLVNSLEVYTSTKNSVVNFDSYLKASTIIDLLNMFTVKYGSVYEYLSNLGFTDIEIKKLRERVINNGTEKKSVDY